MHWKHPVLGSTVKKKKKYTCQITITILCTSQMSDKQHKDSAPRSKQQDFQGLAIYQHTAL